MENPAPEHICNYMPIDEFEFVFASFACHFSVSFAEEGGPIEGPPIGAWYLSLKTICGPCFLEEPNE
jgi:hypothetical protein